MIQTENSYTISSDNITMASQSISTSALPQGFSVYQPTLGAPLQFFPALGTQQLDEMMHAYLPGTASIKEKRATVSLDFLEHAQLTGQTFKFYAVYSISSPYAPSPVNSASSSFNVSPATSSWDWSQTPSTDASVSSSSRSRKPSKASSPVSRHQTTDFSHLPGMKIMTREGLDVTNSASRGSKTKEQRDHAHLMRIIKACDACKRKKIRCDPSHKKRSAPQAQSQASLPKPAKKARTVSQKATAVSPPVTEGQFDLPSAFNFDPTFTFADLEGIDSTMAMAANANESWEEFIQFPAADMEEDYDFFYDPEGYLSSQSSAASSQPSPFKASTPNSQQESNGVPGLEVDFADSQSTSPQLPFLDQVGSVSSYTDFNLFSPGSTFSEDDRMVSISSSRELSPNQPSIPECPVPGSQAFIGGDGVTDWTGLGTTVSPLQTIVANGGEYHDGAEFYDPGSGLDGHTNYYAPQTLNASDDQFHKTAPPGGTTTAQPQSMNLNNQSVDHVSTMMSTNIAGSASIGVTESVTPVGFVLDQLPDGIIPSRSEPSVETTSRSSPHGDRPQIDSAIETTHQSSTSATSASASPGSVQTPGRVESQESFALQQSVRMSQNLTAAHLQPQQSQSRSSHADLSPSPAGGEALNILVSTAESPGQSGVVMSGVVNHGQNRLASVNNMSQLTSSDVGVDHTVVNVHSEPSVTSVALSPYNAPSAVSSASSDTVSASNHAVGLLVGQHAQSSQVPVVDGPAPQTDVRHTMPTPSQVGVKPLRMTTTTTAGAIASIVAAFIFGLAWNMSSEATRPSLVFAVLSLAAFYHNISSNPHGYQARGSPLPSRPDDKASIPMGTTQISSPPSLISRFESLPRVLSRRALHSRPSSQSWTRAAVMV